MREASRIASMPGAWLAAIAMGGCVSPAGGQRTERNESDAANDSPTFVEASDTDGAESHLPSCNVPLPALRACMAQTSPIGRAAIDGTIESADSGEFDCLGIGYSHRPGTTAGLWTHAITSEGGTNALSTELPWPSPIFEVGDAVDVSYEFIDEEVMGSGAHGEVTVLSAAGQLLAWMTGSQTEATFEPPGLAVTTGAATCTRTVASTEYVEHAFVIESDGDTFELGFGEIAQHGAFVFVHGGNADIPDGGIDAFPRATMLFITRAELSDLQ